MPDPTPTPAPQPAPKHSREVINQADLGTLKDSRGVALAAQDTNHVAKLTEKAVAVADVATLLADIDDAETKKAPAVLTANSAKETATAHEETAKKALMVGLRDIQGAVKRKFETSDPSKLTAYFIGKKNFGDDRQGLETDGQSMLDQAAGDALPGINAATITATTALLKAWITADDDQRKAGGAFGAARTAFKSALDSIKQRTRNLQLAANSAWSHTDPANGATRRAFGLSPDRPLS